MYQDSLPHLLIHQVHQLGKVVRPEVAVTLLVTTTYTNIHFALITNQNEAVQLKIAPRWLS